MKNKQRPDCYTKPKGNLNAWQWWFKVCRDVIIEDYFPFWYLSSAGRG